MSSLVEKLGAIQAEGPVQIDLALAGMTMDVIGGSAFGCGAVHLLVMQAQCYGKSWVTGRQRGIARQSFSSSCRQSFVQCTILVTLQ